MLLLSITSEWVHNLRKGVKEAHLYKPSVKERSVWYSEVKVDSVIPRCYFGARYICRFHFTSRPVRPSRKKKREEKETTLSLVAFYCHFAMYYSAYLKLDSYTYKHAV
jgi:hypothetical protein